MKNWTLAALIILVSLSFSSCTKQGPQGPQGATGAPGAPGTNLFSYAKNGYIAENSFNGTSGNYFITIQIANLDSSPSTMVEGYFTVGNPKTNVYTPMPAENVFSGGDLLYLTYGDNEITIWYTGSSEPQAQITYWIDITQP